MLGNPRAHAHPYTQCVHREFSCYLLLCKVRESHTSSHTTRLKKVDIEKEYVIFSQELFSSIVLR